MGGEQVFQKLIPGTQNQTHKIVKGGHFLQEDAGPELAKILVDFYKTQRK
jgi:haloalkane dehalogenase